METKIYKNYLIDILSNNIALTTYTAYLVDDSMTPVTSAVNFTVTSATKDATGVKMSISNLVWSWTSLGGEFVRGVLIKKEDTMNAIFIDLGIKRAIDGDFVINWTYAEFFRFKINNIM